MSGKISFFKNSSVKVPTENITLEDFLNNIKHKWRGPVLKLRQTGNKKLKDALPAVTISGQFKTRDGKIELSKKLIAHTGYICIDIDAKDNPKLSTSHIVDHECAAQFISCRGEGLKIIYKCAHVYTQAEHWRIYDAIIERLEKKNIAVKVDSIVKSIAALQYVTYDPEPYVNLKTKLVIKPLPPIKIKKRPGNVDTEKELKILNSLIDELGKKDITTNYEDWNNIAFGLSYSLGDKGREAFHRLSKHYKDYSKAECDEKYDSHIQRDPEKIARPITIATVYDLIAGHVSSKALKQLQTQKGAAVGVGTGEECPDLAGMVQYRLFLFKKIVDKEDKGRVKALLPHSINPIAFGKLLQTKSIFRFENAYVKIRDNVVEKVDAHTILWEISKYIEEEGNYEFTYKGESFIFNWEDLLYVWKTAKAHSSVGNSIASEVPFWVPNLLNDEPHASFIPYQNGVVKVSKNKVELLKYSNIQYQIWKDDILPRNFKLAKKSGMFEKFFGNVMGRGDSDKKKKASTEYNRAVWYFGYMLHTVKNPSTSRAWMLYDVKAGNNGRSGKSLIGQALGYIRHVTTIDGKQIDFRNRFWLQTVKPWTKIIFIDDPRVGMSLLPMFNMITGTVQADRKSLSPLEIRAKFLFASNWILENDGHSEAGRQFISQLSPFYTEYAVKHNNELRPLVHLHGKEFFTEWNEQDWSEFDTFAVQCLQYYFSNNTPQDFVIGNAHTLQFVQRYGEEAFNDLIREFIKHADFENKYIARDRFIEVIKAISPNATSKEAGVICRYVLKCVGCGDVKVTTIYKNRLDVPVYMWTSAVILQNVKALVEI